MDIRVICRTRNQCRLNKTSIRIASCNSNYVYVFLRGESNVGREHTEGQGGLSLPYLRLSLLAVTKGAVSLLRVMASAGGLMEASTQNWSLVSFSLRCANNSPTSPIFL
jgi:hypothetical protein